MTHLTSDSGKDWLAEFTIQPGFASISGTLNENSRKCHECNHRVKKMKLREKKALSKLSDLIFFIDNESS